MVWSKERTQKEGKRSKSPAQQTLETPPSAAMPPVGWSSHWEFIGKGMVGMLWQGQDMAGFVLGIGACTSQLNKHR